MPLTQVEEKYINITLSDLLERAVGYLKLADRVDASRRDRAVWKLVATDAVRAYNTALRTLGLVASSKLAQEQKVIVDKLLNPANVGLLTPEDVDEIITRVYGVSQLEREQKRRELGKELAKGQVVAANCPETVKNAIKTIIKSGEAAKFLNLDKIMQDGSIPMPDKLPRGNSQKGGLVSKYLREGKSHNQAVALAELDIANEESGAQASSIGLPLSIQEAILKTESMHSIEPRKDSTLELLESLEEASNESLTDADFDSAD